MDHSPRPRLSSWILFACLLLLAAFYATWVWTDTLTDGGGDSSAYLIISRLYSPYHTASPASLAYKGGIISPPLFPFLLSLVDGGYRLLNAHLLVAGFALATSAATYFWLRREAFDWWVAAAMALTFSILPITLQLLFNVWSEFPYLFFSMAAIAMLAPSTAQSTRRAWFGAAAMVACACLIRVAALPLLAAFLAYLLIQRPKHSIALGALAALPFACWALYSATYETGAVHYVKEFSDSYTGDYASKLIHQVGAEYDGVFTSWKTAWLRNVSSPMLEGIVTGFWFICIAGWLYRLVRLKFDAIYGAFYVIELFLWPHPEVAMRYSLVLYPLFIGSGFLLAGIIPKRFAEHNGRPYVAGTAAIVILIAVLPAFLEDIKLFTAPMPADIEAARHTEDWYNPDRGSAIIRSVYTTHMFRHIQQVGGKIPPNDCVFAIKPSVVTLLTDRISKNPPASAVDDAEFKKEIAACRYAYLMPFNSATFSQSYYPRARLDGKFKTIDRLDNENGVMEGALVELEP